MSIDELLDVMDETLEDALNVPFSGGKRMVDVEKVRELIDDIRLNMPQEIQQAKAVVKDRTQIVEKAKREADMIIKRAEERARAMVAEEAIMKTAQQKATEMITSAQNQSREMRATVTNYCENMLRQTEEQLSSSLRRRLLHRSRTPPARKPILPLMPRTTRRLRAVRISGKKMKASSSWILLRMQSRTDRTMMPSRASSSASKARVHKQI